MVKAHNTINPYAEEDNGDSIILYFSPGDIILSGVYDYSLANFAALYINKRSRMVVSSDMFEFACVQDKDSIVSFTSHEIFHMEGISEQIKEIIDEWVGKSGTRIKEETKLIMTQIMNLHFDNAIDKCLGERDFKMIDHLQLNKERILSGEEPVPVKV